MTKKAIHTEVHDYKAMPIADALRELSRFQTEMLCSPPERTLGCNMEISVSFRAAVRFYKNEAAAEPAQQED